MSSPPAPSEVSAALPSAVMAPIEAAVNAPPPPPPVVLAAPVASGASGDPDDDNQETPPASAEGRYFGEEKQEFTAGATGHSKKNAWTTEEDAMLARIIAEQGHGHWTKVAAHLPGRMGRQCRERWFNHLAPEVKKGDWSHEEDQLIVNAVREYGTKWSLIQKSLPGRSDNSIKNRWVATPSACTCTCTCTLPLGLDLGPCPAQWMHARVRVRNRGHGAYTVVTRVPVPHVTADSPHPPMQLVPQPGPPSLLLRSYYSAIRKAQRLEKRSVPAPSAISVTADAEMSASDGNVSTPTQGCSPEAYQPKGGVMTETAAAAMGIVMRHAQSSTSPNGSPSGKRKQRPPAFSELGGVVQPASPAVLTATDATIPAGLAGTTAFAVPAMAIAEAQVAVAEVAVAEAAVPATAVAESEVAALAVTASEVDGIASAVPMPVEAMAQLA